MACAPGTSGPWAATTNSSIRMCCLATLPLLPGPCHPHLCLLADTCMAIALWSCFCFGAPCSEPKQLPRIASLSCECFPRPLSKLYPGWWECVHPGENPSGNSLAGLCLSCMIPLPCVGAPCVRPALQAEPWGSCLQHVPCAHLKSFLVAGVVAR